MSIRAASWRRVTLAVVALLAAGVSIAPSVALAAGRVALVVGNSRYGAIGTLSNPRNNASDVSAALGRLGFEVTTTLDADRAGLDEALRRFARRSAGADVAAVFYVGHGIDVDGVNYLVPVHPLQPRVTDVRFETVVLDDVLAATAGAAWRVVVLDACRNDPLARSMQRTSTTRSVSRGNCGALNENLLGDETLVAYAAAAGTTAADGTGRNSPYTTALMTRNFANPGEWTRPRTSTPPLDLIVRLLAFACSFAPWPARSQDRVALEPAAASAESSNCEAWNTEEFFETATASVVTACLVAGASPAAVGDDGITPLHRAAAVNGNSAVIEALLAAGADPSTRSQSVGTPLSDEAAAVIAVGWGQPESTVFQLYPVAGNTPLHYAARFNENPAVVEALLTAGADVTVRDEFLGNTPLHYAARFNENPAVVEALLGAGADVAAHSLQESRTPLHEAGFNENPAVVEALLAAGADVTARDGTYGGTPLHLAARWAESAAVVEVLLSAGADVAARSRFASMTPLHHAAARNENPAVLEALLAAGADVAAQDIGGGTPLHVAAERNQNPAVIIEVLAGAGADAAAPDAGGSTPLHRAAYRSGNENVVVEALLDAGASLDARDETGNTPLHVAAGHTHGFLAPAPAVGAIEALLNAGADRTVLNAAGETPWDLAQKNLRLWRVEPAVYRELREAAR